MSVAAILWNLPEVSFLDKYKTSHNKHFEVVHLLHFEVQKTLHHIWPDIVRILPSKKSKKRYFWAQSRFFYAHFEHTNEINGGIWKRIDFNFLTLFSSLSRARSHPLMNSPSSEYLIFFNMSLKVEEMIDYYSLDDSKFTFEYVVLL